jgi:hypothetical protein
MVAEEAAEDSIEEGAALDPHIPLKKQEERKSRPLARF